MWKNKQKAVVSKSSTPDEYTNPLASPETFPPKKGLTYNEKREFEGLEKEISDLQAQQEAINLAFQSD